MKINAKKIKDIAVNILWYPFSVFKKKGSL